MSLKEISTSDLVSVSGGTDIATISVFPNVNIEQFFLNFLATVSSDEMKNFVRDNVSVDVNVQVLYYPQLDDVNPLN